MKEMLWMRSLRAPCFPIRNLCVDSIVCVKGKAVPYAVLPVTAESVCQIIGQSVAEIDRFQKIVLHAGGIQRVDRGVAVIRLFLNTGGKPPHAGDAVDRPAAGIGLILFPD